jgi:hypothetical protein
MNAKRELFDYLGKHYPESVSDATLTNLINNVWKQGVSDALKRAKQIERDHELDERISYFIKDLLKDPKPCGCDPTKGPCSYCGTLSD